MKPKKSIFSKIFGLSNKTNVKNIPEVSESDDTTEFKNEIKEIFEENKKEDSQLDFEENDNGEKINYEFKEKLKSKSSETNSENEDDLLQIPAFLRRQAN